MCGRHSVARRSIAISTGKKAGEATQGTRMRVCTFAIVVLVGITGVVSPADGQQNPVTPSVVECTAGVNSKECEASQLDALFKKLDRAKAALDVKVHSAPMHEYALAIQTAVMRNWLRPDGIPQAQCRVHVVQLLGGKVVSATVDPSCPYDDAGRLSVEKAVLRTGTLPYKGFESVFQPNITLTFMPWSPDDSHAGP